MKVAKLAEIKLVIFMMSVVYRKFCHPSLGFLTLLLNCHQEDKFDIDGGFKKF